MKKIKDFRLPDEGTHLARKHALQMTPGERRKRIAGYEEQTEETAEGRMMRDQLDIIMDAADEIYDMVDDNDDLPEWCQNKITKAKDYIDTVRDYMFSQEKDNDDDDDKDDDKKDD